MRSSQEGRLFALAPALFLLLFFALPVLVLFGYAILNAETALGSSLERLWKTPYYRARILFTLQQATLSTLLTLATGLPLAYLFSHCHWPGRRILRAAFTAPFVLPALIVALALQAWMGPNGLLGWDLLSAAGPLGAILIAHVFYNVSLVIRLVGNYWERLPPAFRETGQTLGQSRAAAIWRIELPLLRPALVAAGLLVFVFCFTSFGIILLLGAPRAGTLETLIYEELRSFRPDYATAALLAILQLLVTYAAMFLFARLQHRLSTTWNPRAALERAQLPPWGAPALAAASLFLIGPPVALALASFRTLDGWGLENYRALVTQAAPLGSYALSDALLNSLRFGIGTLLLALPLATLAALAAHRQRNAWTQALLLLPLGLSAIVVGLGFLLTWNGRPLPDLRTGGLWIVLAHTLVAFPFATRVLLPSLDAIPPSLRDTARTLGASTPRLLARLELPLAYPALGVAAVFAFAASLGEFGAALLLRRPETTTLPLAIYDALSHPGPLYRGEALALATLLLLVALAGFLLIERLRVRPWGEFA